MFHAKKIFFIVVIVVTAWFPLTSASVHGTVSDFANGKLLPEARLVIVDKLNVEFADKNGRFTFSNLLPGDYLLKVYCENFIPMEFKISLKENESHQLDVKMLKDSLLRHEVLVTGTKTNHTVGDIPVAGEVITNTEIKERNLKNVQDVFDAMSGVRIRRTAGTWGNKGNIELQGMDAKHTLIMVDGQKYLGGHGAVDIASIPVNMIRKIEVVKGPSSVLYGSDAMGGVVNIITHNAFERKNSLNLSSFLGSDNTQVYEATTSYNHERFGAMMALTKKSSDGIDKETDSIDERSLTGKIDYKFNPYLTLSLAPRYEYSKLDVEERTQKRVTLNSTMQWSNNKGSVVKLRGSMFSYKHSTGDLASDWDDKVYEIELSGTHLFSEHHMITGGYHLESETIDDRGKDYEADQTIHSFFLQDEITYRPITLVIGARIDRHNLWGETFNPKASMKFNISDSFRLRASVGRAFRAPKLVKLYGEWNMGVFLVKPNKELEPEKSFGFQLGVEWLPWEKFVLNASLFNQDVKDLIVSRFDRSQRPWILSWFNVDKARIRGVDVSLRMALTPNIMLKTVYTYVDSKDKDSGEPLLNRPEHSGAIVFNWEIPSLRLGLNIAGHYTGSRLVEMEVARRQYEITSLSPFATMDLSITKKITRFVRLFVSIRNIFNNKNVYDEYNLDGTKIFGGIDLNF